LFSYHFYENHYEYFEQFFSKPSQISGLPDGVNRFYKKSFAYSDYTRISDRQTDGNAISIVEHLPRNARWVVDFICCITRGSIHCGSVESHYLPIEV